MAPCAVGLPPEAGLGWTSWSLLTLHVLAPPVSVAGVLVLL